MSNITVFLFCRLGSLTTIQFHRFGDISYNSEWYKMPIEQRNYIELLIADAQRPLIFHGLKLVDLNLLTFTKVQFTLSYYIC